MPQHADSLDLLSLGARLREGLTRPGEVVETVLARIAARGSDNVWIHKLPREVLLERAAELERRGPAGLPLYGIPFAIKDNIDLAGQPTTAACPATSAASASRPTSPRPRSWRTWRPAACSTTRS